MSHLSTSKPHPRVRSIFASMKYDVWIKSQTAPSNISKMIKLSNSMLLMVSGSNNMYIYNQLYKTWMKPGDLQNITSHQIKSITMNYDNNELYLVTIRKNHAKILRFYYQQKICTFIRMKSIKLNNYFMDSEKILCIVINDKLHLIRNQSSNFVSSRDKMRNKFFHHIYDPDTMQNKITPINEDLHGISMIYDQIQNELMLFKKMKCIKTYSFYHKKWLNGKKVNNIRVCMEKFGYFLTPNRKLLNVYNGKYAVVFGDGSLNDVGIVYTKWETDNDSFDIVPVCISKRKPSEYMMLLARDNEDDILLHGLFRICVYGHKMNNNVNNEPVSLPMNAVNIIYCMAGKLIFHHLFNDI